MDPDLMYDEFGNYIGPELESDDDEESAEEQEDAGGRAREFRSGLYRTIPH